MSISPLLIVTSLPSSIWDNLGEYVFNPEQKGAMLDRTKGYFSQPEQREVRPSVAGGVASYFNQAWPLTSRRCGLLLPGGVACYLQEVWHIISMKCGVLVQEGNVLCTDCCFGPWCSVVNGVQCDSSDVFCYRKCISPQQLRTLSRLLLANMTDQNMFR